MLLHKVTCFYLKYLYTHTPIEMNKQYSVRWVTVLNAQHYYVQLFKCNILFVLSQKLVITKIKKISVSIFTLSVNNHKT